MTKTTRKYRIDGAGPIGTIVELTTITDEADNVIACTQNVLKWGSDPGINGTGELVLID